MLTGMELHSVHINNQCTFTLLSRESETRATESHEDLRMQGNGIKERKPMGEEVECLRCLRQLRENLFVHMSGNHIPQSPLFKGGEDSLPLPCLKGL